MSWIQKLYETYEQCIGGDEGGAELLMPISHATQQAQIEIVVGIDGEFRRASVVEKSLAATLVPCTEESGGRTGSAPVNHPLCDKLQYIAADFEQFGGTLTSGFLDKPNKLSNAIKPYFAYMKSLSEWAGSEFNHPKVAAILAYVSKGHVVQDLIKDGVLHTDEGGKLLKKWDGEKNSKPPIFKVMAGAKEQQDAFVRWRVEAVGKSLSATWQDQELIDAWIKFDKSNNIKSGFCMVTGKAARIAQNHPRFLRDPSDGAKLISANDFDGYTFRGRFTSNKKDYENQACSISFDVTQKAHNALRWLIRRQAYRNNDQVIVSWAVSGRQLPNPFANTLELFGMGDLVVVESHHLDTAQAFSLRLNKAIAGFGARLNPRDDVVVMGLDSATPGRMAITFYRELLGSEFLQRVRQWHTRCAWSQNLGKDKKFTGAPSPKYIAEAAFGHWDSKYNKISIDEKILKVTAERLLPCIIDGQSIPRDLVESTKRRTCNRAGLGRLGKWVRDPEEREVEFEKLLGITCSLHKAFYYQRNYQMSLETERISRDYLYGRMLAIAEKIEAIALSVAGEKRDTTAARLMQRFSDRPFSTWKTIELALVSYKTRLRSRRTGFLVNMEKLLDEVSCAFQADDYTNDRPLSGEFLLGYHCQRQALKPSDVKGSDTESNQDNDEN